MQGFIYLSSRQVQSKVHFQKLLVHNHVSFANQKKKSFVGLSAVSSQCMSHCHTVTDSIYSFIQGWGQFHVINSNLINSNSINFFFLINVFQFRFKSNSVPIQIQFSSVSNPIQFKFQINSMGVFPTQTCET